MPLYEYECDKCRSHFDKRQKFVDEAVAECPTCQSKAHRVFCPAPVIFKGSGFYVTDYRKEKDTDIAPKPAVDAAKKPEVSSTKSADTSAKKADETPKKVAAPAK